MKWLRQKELLPSDIVMGMLAYSKKFATEGVIDGRIYDFFKDPKNTAPVKPPHANEIEETISSASVWGILYTSLERNPKLKFEIGEKTIRKLGDMYSERYSKENMKLLKTLGEKFDNYLESSPR